MDIGFEPVSYKEDPATGIIIIKTSVGVTFQIPKDRISPEAWKMIEKLNKE